MEGNKDQLANNREVALKHLEVTERNSANIDFVKEEYQSTLNAYLGKLSPEEKQLPESWYVPHFSIVRIEKQPLKFVWCLTIVCDIKEMYLSTNRNRGE